MQVSNLNLGDRADLLATERVKHHRFVYAVDELGPEMLADHLHHRHLHLLVTFLAGKGLDDVRAQVRGHHDHRVAEVDRTPLTIGQTAIIEHLQQHIEHIRVGFLDLVHKDHAVRPAAHRLGQVAALLVTDITRRGTDQAGHGVLLHELRHVDTHHRLFGVEQELGERLAQLGLAHAGRAEEQERAVRPVGVRKTGARTPDRIRHGTDGLGLPDHALGQLLFHAQQFLLLALEHL